jgi:hypothetical protein
MSRSAVTALAASLALAAALFVGACAGPKSTVIVHPEKVAGLPICTSCHNAEFSAANHDSRWMKSHGAVALRDQRTCETCHQTSSCADCHGNKEEIKPSDKRPSRFDPVMPHRGDYITQHRADGRLDPASCFPCHGRKNQERCRVCHK